MKIREIKFEDLSAIAELHKRTFDRTHFTSVFPINFLIKYFEALMTKNEFCFAAFDEDRIVGYLIAGENTIEAVNEFTKRNLLLIVRVLLNHPSFIVEKFSSLLKGIFHDKDQNIPKLNIYIIASAQEKRNGVGKFLLRHFETIAAEKGLSTYSLSVRKNNSKAIDFYLRNGFIQAAQNNTSIVYQKSLG